MGEEDLSSEDISSASHSVLLFVFLYLLEKDPPKKLRHLPHARRASPDSWYYSQGDSARITGAQLRALTPNMSSLIALTLWIHDFKWLQGSHKRGIDTRVHFGYAPMYGKHRRLKRSLEAFQLKGDILNYAVSDKGVVERTDTHVIKSIEFPLVNDSYIMVRYKTHRRDR